MVEQLVVNFFQVALLGRGHDKSGLSAKRNRFRPGQLSNIAGHFDHDRKLSLVIVQKDANQVSLT